MKLLDRLLCYFGLWVLRNQLTLLGFLLNIFSPLLSSSSEHIRRNANDERFILTVLWCSVHFKTDSPASPKSPCE